MESFSLVIFGFSGNLAQLKIIPALYDLEAKGNLSPDTKVIGIGRKDLNAAQFVSEVLHTPNRHHQHAIDNDVLEKLTARCEYIREDFANDSEKVYKELKKYKGNLLFYLATYPELYEGIFENLKKYDLNKSESGWTKIMIEKPIGNDLDSSINLNKLLSIYFEQKDIFRVDHYLGKQDLEEVFAENIDASNVDNIQLSVLEDFGIGKRGVYYDATGALIDMGQNHFMQMVASVAKDSLTVEAREKVIKSLVPERQSLVFGQYEGYKDEENVSSSSDTDTFFALKTRLSEGAFKDIPIYMRSGKKLTKSEVKIAVVHKDGTSKSWVITSTGVGKKYDPYEKLIMEAVGGNQFYFNSSREVESAWRFIDALSADRIKPFIYKPGTDGPKEAHDLIKNDGRDWV